MLMKHLKTSLFLMLVIASTNSFALAETANIKMKIAGVKDNSYFLCIPNIGCLSIFAADKGKVFSIMHPIEMDTMYIANANNSLRLTPQLLPNSCNVTVNENQTITISGNIVANANAVVIKNLHCSIS